MANRKQPSVLPAQPGNCPNDHDGCPYCAPLPQQQFDNVIRAINLVASSATVRQLEVALGAQLDRLRIRRRARLGLVGVPVGSDHMDAQSLYRWAEKIERTDGDAISQLQLIHATAARRLGMG